jgi:hypothetical protein
VALDLQLKLLQAAVAVVLRVIWFRVILVGVCLGDQAAARLTIQQAVLEVAVLLGRVMPVDL